MTFVLSNDSGSSNVESLTSLVGNSIASSGPGSDSVSSGVKGPPLLVVLWVVRSDSESVLVSTNMLMPEEGSSVGHSRSNLELSSVSEWVSWVVVALSVNNPSLVDTVVALVPDDVSMVRVRLSVNIEASHSHISNVSSGSIEPSDLLEGFFFVVSDDSGITVVVPVVSSILDRDNSVSVGS